MLIMLLLLVPTKNSREQYVALFIIRVDILRNGIVGSSFEGFNERVVFFFF